jgi:hypothetical protein
MTSLRIADVRVFTTTALRGIVRVFDPSGGRATY